MIKIASSEEFTRLLDCLAEDVVQAHVHWKLFNDFNAALKKTPLVRAQSRTFWFLTERAHVDAVVMRLCRAFDTHDKGLHLYSLLKAIEGNLYLFDRPEFERRLSENPFVESLAEPARMPDPDTLRADIKLCAADNELVKRLFQYRSSLVAHRNAKETARGRDLKGRFEPTWGEVEQLLDRAITILNRYSSLFAATTHSTQMVGRDDFKYVINAAAEAIDRFHREIEGE